MVRVLFFTVIIRRGVHGEWGGFGERVVDLSDLVRGGEDVSEAVVLSGRCLGGTEALTRLRPCRRRNLVDCSARAVWSAGVLSCAQGKSQLTPRSIDSPSWGLGTAWMFMTYRSAIRLESADIV
jgi:hypothetical protein